MGRTKKCESKNGVSITFDRVQSGVRIDKRLLKVMKGLAEYHDISLCSLMELIILGALESGCGHVFPNSNRDQIELLKNLYHLDYSLDDYIRLMREENGKNCGR